MIALGPQCTERAVAQDVFSEIKCRNSRFLSTEGDHIACWILALLKSCLLN